MKMSDVSAEKKGSFNIWESSGCGSWMSQQGITCDAVFKFLKTNLKNTETVVVHNTSDNTAQIVGKKDADGRRTTEKYDALKKLMTAENFKEGTIFDIAEIFSDEVSANEIGETFTPGEIASLKWTKSRGFTQPYNQQVYFPR